jgi:TPR repeat protein
VLPLIAGLRYADGQGVVKDEAKAVQWYEAAAPGTDKAQFALGL